MKARDRQTGLFKKVFVKALDSLPVGSEIDFDGDTSDIPVGWEQVANPDSYSAEEVKTNKVWFGKPVYRKVITANITGTGQQNIAHNITNLENIVKCNGVIKVGTNEWFILPMSGPTDNISGYGLSIQSVNTTNILVFSGSNMGSTTRTINAILEYTKTTD